MSTPSYHLSPLAKTLPTKWRTPLSLSHANCISCVLQVQALVENKKSLNLEEALRVAASVQPVSVPISNNDEVSLHYGGLAVFEVNEQP